MKVTIDIYAGSNHMGLTQRDMDKNINALRRAVDRKSLSHDFILLLDTISILEGIKKQLQKGNNK